MPDNRKPPAGTGGVSENDLLTGDLLHSNADAHSVVDAAWRQLVGLMLSAPPLELARELLDGLPPAPDPTLRWWLDGARRCVATDVVPMVATVADANITAGVDAPPGMRGLILTRGNELLSDVAGVPMVCAAELVRIVRDGAVRHAVEIVGQRLTTAAWRGDDDVLAEFVKGQAAELLLLAERVTR